MIVTLDADLQIPEEIRPSSEDRRRYDVVGGCVRTARTRSSDGSLSTSSQGDRAARGVISSYGACFAPTP